MIERETERKIAKARVRVWEIENVRGHGGDKKSVKGRMRENVKENERENERECERM